MVDSAVIEDFPREDFRALLHAAQELFTSDQSQRNLLASLGLSRAIKARQKYTVPNPPLTAAQHGTVTIGESGRDGDDQPLSPARFANELLELVATPATLDVALTLARRATKELSGTEPRWRQLIDRLQALQKKYRSHREALDLEGYQAWLGFECKHPYSLTKRFVGRESQLAQLDAWSGSDDDRSVLCLCALGGGGKSALAWTWLARSMTGLRQGGYHGAFWCSFYEKNFNFDEFLRRALMFAGRMEEADVPRGRGEVENRLLEVFKTKRFLFVLDGLERLMNGYAMVADRAMDLEGQGEVLKHAEVPRIDRRMVDLRDSEFLRRLATTQSTRILITTRLEPADLQEPESDAPLPHVGFIDIPGFSRNEAEELWQQIAPSAPVSDAVHRAFQACGYHPLVISIMARSVRHAGGTWEDWLRRETHRSFDPRGAASEAAVRSHIIGICMRDLPEESYDLLGVLTATGKPMHLDELSGVLLLGSQASGDRRWGSQEAVKAQLDLLVNLGYVGEATPPNQPTEYDVHPVVRGAAWGLLLDPKRERFLEHALSEVAATPDRRGAGSLSDLNHAMALYRLFAKSRQLDRAWEMLSAKLQPLLERNGANRELFDLYRQLLPDSDPIQLLPLTSRRAQGDAAATLGGLLNSAGEGELADRVLRWCGAIRLQIGDHLGFLNAAHSRAWRTMYEGRLFETELALHGIRLEALVYGALEWCSVVDCWIGIVLALRGEEALARRRFDAARGKTFSHRWWLQGLAEGLVYLDAAAEALEVLNLLPNGIGADSPDGPMQAAWEKLTRGLACFRAGDHDAALEHLSEARTDARKANYAIIQCFAIPYIAELKLRDGRVAEACEILESYKELDPHPSYAMCAAEARRVGAKCELKKGNVAAAAEAARAAYRLAACDGPPFTYRAGLQRAFEALEECGTYVPSTRARLDPQWKEKLDAIEEDEREEERMLALHAILTSGGVPKALSLEGAIAAIEEPPVLREASEADRIWWEAVAGKRPSVKVPLTTELQRSGITLDAFRQAFARSPHKSFSVVFYQLNAERLLAPNKPQPVCDLDPQSVKTWLADSAAHNKALETFLSTNIAEMVRRPFAVHQFDDKDILAFLNDRKRRIEVAADPRAARLWGQLEEQRPALDMLVLAECVLQVRAKFSDVIDAFSINSSQGLAYAFASILTRRAIENHEANHLSKTEGWTPVQVLLRLQDVKLRLGWLDAGDEPKRFWERIELENDHRRERVLELAEELARRTGTIDGYYQAYVASNTENIQANLAYVDYLRHRSEVWQDAQSWPATEVTERWAYDTMRPTYTHPGGLTDEQVTAREQILQERLGWERASDTDKAWWDQLTQRMQPRVRLRLLEELDVRRSSLAQLRTAYVNGQTENPIAALAYLDFVTLKTGERHQAEERASEHNRTGNSLYGEGKYREAITSYDAAIKVLAEPVYYTNLAGAWERVADLGPTEALSQAIDVLRRGLAQWPDHAALKHAMDAAMLRQRLLAQGAFPRHAKSIEMLPVVSPVALEVASDLIPIVEVSDFLQGTIPAMRERIMKDMGVRTPGLRVRGNEADLPEGTYIIMLDEIPLVLGNVSLDRAMTLAPREELARLAIKGEETTDPLTGQGAHWVPLAEATRLPGPHWDAAAYMTRHLESVLRRNLAMFLGMQEAVASLEAVWSPAAQGIATDRALVTRFARTLQALVNESVPITEMEAICETFAEHTGRDDSMDDLLRNIRALPDVLRALPANQSGIRLFNLSEGIEKELSNGLVPVGDEHFLALPPELTQEILAAVRRNVSSPSTQGEAIVVRDPRIQRYARKLLELEFPHLYTLSEAELLEPLRAHPRTAIALE